MKRQMYMLERRGGPWARSLAPKPLRDLLLPSGLLLLDQALELFDVFEPIERIRGVIGPAFLRGIHELL